MDDNEKNNLQTLLEYYRNKCNKLEHDFVLYQSQAEAVVRQLREQVQQLAEDGSEEAQQS